MGDNMIELNDKAKVVLLAQKLKYLRSLTLRLFQNDWRPSGTDSAADYVEATFAGYLPQDLTDFGPAFLNPSGQGQTNSCVHTFRQSVAVPANTVYGYYVTDRNGYLIFSERRVAGPVVMNAVNATYIAAISFLEDTYR